MAAEENYKKFAILFVDDEPQALKYFRKAYEKDFRILTAASAAEALALLEREGEEVGVLISDQRMPGQPGVELLATVRRQRPGIVRILTTAYSELDNAIEAVNSGAVFRYVTKPWDLRELKGILLRAMDFYLVQRERDLLLREKLSVLQRMVVLDRVRSFTVLAAALSHRLRNSLTALKAFLDYAPVNLAEPAAPGAVQWGDLWTLAQREGQRIVEAVEGVVRTTLDVRYAFAGDVALGEVVRAQVQALAPGLAAHKLKAEVEIPADLPALKGDREMLERLVHVLLTRMASLTPEGSPISIRVQPVAAVAGAPGVALRLRGGSAAWEARQLSSLFGALRPGGGSDHEPGIDLLATFFMAYHHGGDLRLHPAPPQGPGFELLLPLDPDRSAPARLDPDWLESIFTNLEGWNAAGLPAGA